MAQYRLTFAVPAFGDSQYLEECLISLKKQTIPCEIVITSPNTTDYLRTISQKYAVQLAISHDAAHSIARDWSFAYNQTRTPYVTLAHQDDIYAPNYAEMFLTLADELEGNFIFLFSDYTELHGNYANPFIKKLLLFPFSITNHINSYLFKKLLFAFGQPVPTPSVMFNKNKIGTFSFSSEFQCNMDWDAWLRLSATQGSIGYVKNRLMTHRIHSEAQTSLLIKRGIRQKEDAVIFSRLWPHWIALILTHLYGFSTKFAE